MAEENTSSSSIDKSENKDMDENKNDDMVEGKTNDSNNDNKNNNDNDNDNNGTIKLIIYDFDQTITCSHLYRELHGGKSNALSKLSDIKLINIYGGQDRIDILNKHFQFLSSNHIEIGIISFGWTDVIINALKRVKLDIYFKNKIIIGRDSKEIITYNKNKGKVVNALMKDRNLKYNQVLFVDDALSNIEQCGSFCETLHISERNGMNDNDIKYIEKSIYIYNDDEIKHILSKQKQENDKNVNNKNVNNNNNNKHKPNKLAKYKLKNIPKWFDDLNKKDDETPVIEINSNNNSDLFPDFSNGFHINHNDQLDFTQNHQLQIPTKFTFGNDD